MRVTLEQYGNEIIFNLEPEEEDDEFLQTTKVGMGSNRASIDLGGLKIGEIHPDLIGLSTILMCHQFIGKGIHLPIEVSPNFLNTANGILSKYKIVSNSNPDIPPYRPPESARPGLAFSGGADSTAALIVMPGNTIPVFMNRPMSKNSIYDSDAPLKNCELLKQMGYDVKIVNCDLEYLRDPVGFPSDIAHAIPLILLAERLGLGSIAFGTILESAYGIGHRKFIDYPKGSHMRFYGGLLAAVGLEISLPVGGVSEIGTSKIVESSPLGICSQSCIRGKRGSPCLRCWKCFRKEMVTLAQFPDRNVDLKTMMRNSSEVQIRLSAFPISHENVVTYSIQRLEKGRYPFLRLLENRLNTSLDLDFLDYWYSPSKILIPESYRISVIKKISGFMDVMSKEHEEILEEWDMTNFLDTDDAKKSHSLLTSSWQDL